MQENPNLALWNAWSQVPSSAQKTIEKGRLKGKTDINPVWRLKVLTQHFGPCGTGWKYEIVRFWNEPAGSQIMAFAQINLFYKTERGWSDPIPGVGGSMLYVQETNGLHASDEGYKMALTDAISVACKALGVGAGVYWQAGESKYGQPPAPPHQSPPCSPYGGPGVRSEILGSASNHPSLVGPSGPPSLSPSGPASQPPSRSDRIKALRNAYEMSDEVMVTLKTQVAAQHPETAKDLKSMTDLEFTLFYTSFERLAKEWKSSKGA